MGGMNKLPQSDGYKILQAVKSHKHLKLNCEIM